MDTQNKLIADFMGLPLVPCNIGTEHGAVTKGYLHPKINVPCTTYGLQYKCSWDWLMPVVEQIENFGFEFIIAESRVKIKHNTDLSINELLSIDIVGLKIDATYKAVIQFIKEYNK